ncbi:PilZ domain-containing protein [Reinekea sp.]|uniref:PilZ domain-containing protein n=1 Tax=Reinekea sp. TaxID=1970455 RepID=UPI002A7EF141|nr:PilZ domain-containing protein [Reinekea sp.]
MNKRCSQRTNQRLPIRLHFFGDQTDISELQDISNGGFFVRTDTVRQLAKGVVALVSIGNESAPVLAEVVRIEAEGAAFAVLNEVTD